ncbi:MAG: zf-TFIIB domain-containing protein [Actinomycetota bacterium]|nr:zf-TFIIB domain-containing protein [Actinomycetota bacterium]
MQCPNDGAVLVMSERSGIEIDYCPTCRGVWLDRGELDKIIDRASNELGAARGAPAAPSQPVPPQAPPQPQQPAYGQQSYDSGPRGYDNRDYDTRGYDNKGYDNRGFDNRGYDNRGYDNRGYDNRGYDNRGYDQGGYRKKKKESWLSELFD